MTRDSNTNHEFLVPSGITTPLVGFPDRSNRGKKRRALKEVIVGSGPSAMSYRSWFVVSIVVVHLHRAPFQTAMRRTMLITPAVSRLLCYIKSYRFFFFFLALLSVSRVRSHPAISDEEFRYFGPHLRIWPP